MLQGFFEDSAMNTTVTAQVGSHEREDGVSRLSAASGSTRDLVARLRWPEGLSGPEDHPVSVALRIEAADEIEHLRLEHAHACQEIAVAIAERDALVPAQASPDDSPHYLGAIRLRLEELYIKSDDPREREQISDEVDWITDRIGARDPSPVPSTQSNTEAE